MVPRHHGRRPPRRNSTRKHQADRPTPAPSAVHDQPLVVALRAALRSDHPLGLPLTVSQIMSALEGPRAADDALPELGVLVESFLETDVAETTAALHVIAALTTDDLLATRIRRELTARRQPVPESVAGIDRLNVARAAAMSDPLGDGENLLLGVSGPGVDASFVVYVAHDLGTVVKDAFVVPEPFERVLERYAELVEEHGEALEFSPVSTSDARARLEQALANGDDDLVLPSEDWPACRPLLAALVRRMPLGGSGYVDEPDLDPDDLVDLAHAFLASTHAPPPSAEPDDSGLHDLVHAIVGMAADAWRDPLRWSPATVEIVLSELLPTCPGIDDDQVEQVPAVLRGLIRYAHGERDVAAADTDATLAAVDTWMPALRRAWDDPLLRGHRESTAELHALLSDVAVPGRWLRRLLLAQVGGEEALAALDTHPLPDEPLDLSGVPQDVRERVTQVAGLVDGFADSLGADTLPLNDLPTVGHEYRTACRRFLARVARADPAIFRRRGRVDTAAAAVCWAVGRANSLVGYPPAPVGTGRLQEWFGVGSSPSGRAQPMLRALGAQPRRMLGGMGLGMPDLLVSSVRTRLVGLREELDADST